MDRDPSLVTGSDAGVVSERRFRRGDYVARIASDDVTLYHAFRLRYLSYISRGHIASNSSGLFRDDFDDLPSTMTVVVYCDAVPVGSMRICLLRRHPAISSPARLAYREEVDEILSNCDPEDRGYNCFEVNRLVRAPQSADDQGLVFLMLRLAGRIGQDADFKVAISCVRTHHIPFYKRMAFVEAGPKRVYPGLSCEMVLMQLSRARWEDTCQVFRLVDPNSGLPGMFDSLENIWASSVQPTRHSR